jgi:Bacterial type II/III secretion system short domain
VKYRIILACWLLVWATGAAQAAAVAPTASKTTVSLDLRQTPLSQALGIMFQQIDAQYSIGPGVVDSVPITLRVKDMPFETALRTVLRLGNATVQSSASNYPGATYSKIGDMYHIHGRGPTDPMEGDAGSSFLGGSPGTTGGIPPGGLGYGRPGGQPAGGLGGGGFGGGGIGGIGGGIGGIGGFGSGGLGGYGPGGPGGQPQPAGGIGYGPPLGMDNAQTVKVALSFLRPSEAISYLSQQPLAGIGSIQPMARDNTLIVRGDPDAIQELKRLVQLADVPSRPLSMSAGISGPGVNGAPLAIRSTARALVGDEVRIDEQSVLGGQPAHMKVTISTQPLGDGSMKITSDWDVMVPVAGGSRGPIRLVKRLSTTTLARPGERVSVAEVNLSGWGGKGVLRLWLQGDWGQRAEVAGKNGRKGASPLLAD